MMSLTVVREYLSVARPHVMLVAIVLISGSTHSVNAQSMNILDQNVVMVSNQKPVSARYDIDC